MDNAQIIILILRILINLYAQDQNTYNPQLDWFLLTEWNKEKIVFESNFKDVDKIIICDNQLYDNCGFQNEQKIILIGHTQALIELDLYPWRVPDIVYVHNIRDGKPTHFKGYPLRMGFSIDRIHQLQ